MSNLHSGPSQYAPYIPARHRRDSADESLSDLQDIVMRMEHITLSLYDAVVVERVESADSPDVSLDLLRLLATRQKLLALSQAVAKLAGDVNDREIRRYLARDARTRATRLIARRETGSPLARRGRFAE